MHMIVKKKRRKRRDFLVEMHKPTVQGFTIRNTILIFPNTNNPNGKTYKEILWYKGNSESTKSEII